MSTIREGKKSELQLDDPSRSRRLLYDAIFYLHCLSRTLCYVFAVASACRGRFWQSPDRAVNATSTRNAVALFIQSESEVGTAEEGKLVCVARLLKLLFTYRYTGNAAFFERRESPADKQYPRFKASKQIAASRGESVFCVISVRKSPLRGDVSPLRSLIYFCVNQRGRRVHDAMHPRLRESLITAGVSANFSVVDGTSLRIKLFRFSLSPSPFPSLPPRRRRFARCYLNRGAAI